MNAPFGHVLTAMITPFDGEGNVDHGRVWELAGYLVDNGSDGIVVGGTTGEAPTLSTDEKVALFRAVVEAVGDRAVVVAGTGTYDTRESVELTEQAAAAGCHGAMAVTPYYSRPSQEGLIAHFSAIADATDLPVLLYNIPSRTGRLIEVETLARLSEHPRIVAVKDAVGDLAFTTRTKVAAGEALAVYSGDDILTLPMMAVGGVGVVSVATHLAGRQVAEMVAAALAGDWDRARALHLALAPLFQALFVEPNPQPVKGGLNAFWEPVGEPRLPLVPAAPDTVAAIGVALEAARRA
ncbi:MAG: 4-hydroxy-tetrahydrodipicolinate synthase [Actinobacteria bacterium]|nr:4-hydroxy-tetrahydrodipicolinate synthase [Actinomycetota bacterium]MBU1864943.1 4-hydroxy-tetrahydrodipicolinate synthase [Actinomycetota bacterium]